jgi:hypothetical protein
MEVSKLVNNLNAVEFGKAVAILEESCKANPNFASLLLLSIVTSGVYSVLCKLEELETEIKSLKDKSNV